MDIQQATITLINTFAGTIAAIIVIAGVVAKIRPVGKALKRFAFMELYAANDQQDRRLDNLEMQQLKQIICDRRLPDGERLNAGQVYTERGGNGDVKMVYEALQEVAKKKLIEERERAERAEMEKRRHQL
jgi:hypothetical protein